MLAKRIMAVFGLGAAALFLGFATGLGVISVTGWIVPFRYPEDDDTLREFIPVALAYLSFAGVAVLSFSLGLRTLLTRWREPTLVTFEHID